ncbi:MAG: hypothetical protein WBC44_01800 [Planctomycetaceae bacterium]
MSPRRWMLWGILMSAPFAGTASYVAYARVEAAEDRVAEMFGGRDGLKTLTEPDKVEAYRLRPLPQDKQGRRTPLKEFQILSGPVTVPKESAKNVARSLLSYDSYEWDSAKGCLPIYGVRLSFARGDDRVDVLLCFQCDVLLVYRNGKITGGEDFDAIRPVLVRTVKPLFPDDEVVQGLKERG